MEGGVILEFSAKAGGAMLEAPAMAGDPMLEAPVQPALTIRVNSKASVMAAQISHHSCHRTL